MEKTRIECLRKQYAGMPYHMRRLSDFIDMTPKHAKKMSATNKEVRAFEYLHASVGNEVDFFERNAEAILTSIRDKESSNYSMTTLPDYTSV